jgi:hypothetical protein
MATIEAATDRLKSKIVEMYGGQVVFIPPQSDSLHGLLKTFMFVPRSTPTSTGGSLGRSRSEEPEFIEDTKKVFETKPSKEETFVYSTTRNKDSTTGFTVKSDLSKKLAGGHAGYIADKDIDIDAEIEAITKLSPDALIVYNLVKKYARDSVLTDGKLFALVEDTKAAGGNVDIVVGFECVQLKGHCKHIRLSAEGSKNIGVGVKVLGVNPKFGHTLKDDKFDGITDFTGTIGAQFVVVHLRKVVDGSVYGSVDKIRMMGNPVFVDDLNGDNLRDMFYNAMPCLLNLREKAKLKSRSSIFRGFGGKAKDVAEAKEEEKDRMKAFFGDEGDRGEVIVSSLMKGYINDEDFITSQEFDGSWNYVITGPKKKLALLYEKLQSDGSAAFCGTAVTAMSTVQELDMTNFLPIYYNSSSHLDCDPPSTVLCYDTGTPGYWCFRPVDNVPKNEEVVTIYTTEWKVRETLVLVREEDTSLQEALGNIGFHILQSNQRDFNPKEGGVVMGRHELTHSSKPVTELPDVEVCDGFLCKRRRITK